jgi:hypothetical protein
MSSQLNQITSSYQFEKIREVIGDIGVSLEGISPYVTGFFDALPSFAKPLLFLALAFAVVGILLSHALAIYRNKGEWKLKPDSRLMFSYFCGSGSYQRKLIYKEAHKLLRDRTWSWIGFAGPAYRLGNYAHASRMLMFVCSLPYLPLAVLGFVEMVLRDVIGTVWLLCAGLAHFLLLSALRLISYVLMPIWQLADRAARIEQHCPHCYNTFVLPGFRCPYCGVVHEQLIPSRCGVLFARCECGRFLPSTSFVGRANLDAVCPKCGGDLVATNARQFSIQLIGGNASGKTAFLAAFQHIYLENGVGAKELSIHGEPHDDFAKFEGMFKSGVTEPSSSAVAMTYNLVHRFGRDSKHNLVFYDIPDEVVMSGAYERNPLNFGYSDGIIVIIDPLSVPSVRDACMRAGDLKAVENCSKDDVEAIIVRFIHQFSEIVGRSARKMSGVPVAVLIAKTDVNVIKREVGLPVIEAAYNADPASYRNDFARARDEICRKYLLNLGMINTLNNLESVFSNVRFFPVSAIGRTSEPGRAFEPSGVIEPVAWIAEEGRAGVYPMLRDAQESAGRRA